MARTAGRSRSQPRPDLLSCTRALLSWTRDPARGPRCPGFLAREDRRRGGVQGGTGLPIIDNQNPGRCGPCGGECCKRMPGYAAPEDLPDLTELGRMVLSGRWTFDQWDGDPHEETDEVPGLDDRAVPRVFLPRPAIRGHEGKPRHAPWAGGTCTLHGPAGCLLTFERRPIQCRALMPGAPGTDCKGGPSKLDLALAWRPHAADLEDVLAWVLRERGEAPALRPVSATVGETECGPYSPQRIMTSPIA